jgi:hypothetical protein
MSNFKLVDGKKVALSATEEQDLVDSATQHAIDMTEYDAQAYARTRASEYNALNQFELMTDDAANSTTTHADAIAAIKLKHPKS